jgi:predicted O-methyltransferase YrrM
MATTKRISRAIADRAATDPVLHQTRRRVRLALRQRVGAPDLYRLLGPSGTRLADPYGFVHHLIPSANIEDLVTEFADLKTEFETRRIALRVPYERFHDIEGNSMLLCFLLTRILQPETIVETGVGNGASTFFFLRALSTNGHGMLHSFDISDDVGGYLTKADRKTWDLQVLNRRATLRDFARRLSHLRPVDLFLHDSHHRFWYMCRELELAAAVGLSERGVILCDDAESTFAFDEFCRDRGLEPTYVFDRTKFFGGVALLQTSVISR